MVLYYTESKYCNKNNQLIIFHKRCKLQLNLREGLRLCLNGGEWCSIALRSPLSWHDAIADASSNPDARALMPALSLITRSNLRIEMKKKVKKYKLTDIQGQEEDALRYWASKSIKKKIDAMEQIIKNYYELKGLHLHEQRLQRVLKITKLSQG